MLGGNEYFYPLFRSLSRQSSTREVTETVVTKTESQIQRSGYPGQQVLPSREYDAGDLQWNRIVEQLKQVSVNSDQIKKIKERSSVCVLPTR